MTPPLALGRAILYGGSLIQNGLVFGGHVNRVQAFLKAGVDPNSVDDFYVSALERAAQERHSDTVKLLIANGADVNFTNIYGGTPLGAATEVGANDIVDLLKKAGAEK